MEPAYSDMKQRHLVLQRIEEVFGFPMQSETFESDDGQALVEIVRSYDSPFKGVTSYSTLGVFQCRNLLTADNRELNVEFMGICDSRNNWFDGLFPPVHLP